MIEVLRGGERLALEVTPRQGKDGKGNPVWQIGVGFPPPTARPTTPCCAMARWTR
jgi:hypothetical protein